MHSHTQLDITYNTLGTTDNTGGSRRSHWRGPAAASAKNTEQISELGGSGGMPPGKFFFDNAKCCKLGHFYHFCQAFGGGAMAPLAPPLEPPVNRKTDIQIDGELASGPFNAGSD